MIRNEYQRQRTLWLSHIRQVRMMVRDGRYTLSGGELIRTAQQELARLRRVRHVMGDTPYCIRPAVRITS